MQTVFTDAGKVAGFIIQRARIGFEAFTADEKAAGMFETLHRAATRLRELAAQAMPDGDLCSWRPGPSPPIWRAGTWHNARPGDGAPCLE